MGRITKTKRTNGRPVTIEFEDRGLQPFVPAEAKIYGHVEGETEMFVSRFLVDGEELIVKTSKILAEINGNIVEFRMSEDRAWLETASIDVEDYESQLYAQTGS